MKISKGTCRLFVLLATVFAVFCNSLCAQSPIRLVSVETDKESEASADGSFGLTFKVLWNQRVYDFEHPLEVRLITDNGSFVTSEAKSHSEPGETKLLGRAIKPQLLPTDRGSDGRATTYETTESLIATQAGIFKFEASIDGFRTSVTASTRVTFSRSTEPASTASKEVPRALTQQPIGNLSFCDVLNLAIRELPNEFANVRDESSLSDHEVYMYWQSNLFFPNAEAKLSLFKSGSAKVKAVVSYNRPTKVFNWRCIAQSGVEINNLQDVVSNIKECLGNGWKYKSSNKRSGEFIRDSTQVSVLFITDCIYVTVTTWRPSPDDE